MQNSRFEAPRGQRAWLMSVALALIGVSSLTLGASASAQTLERIRAAGRINLGYLPDAPPLSARGAAGAPEGYGIALCEQIAARVGTALGLPQLAVQWVPTTVDGRLRDIQQGSIDLLCTPTIVTLERRQAASFSLPVFAGGNRAVLRADAPLALREALEQTATPRPVWRGTPAAKVLENTTIAVVAGTASATWLEGRRTTLQVDASIVTVPDYRTGLQQLLDHEVDVFFGERTLVLAAMDEAARAELVILQRLFTNEAAALALARGDEEFRLLVDSALSQAYASDGFAAQYARWFGELDADARRFFQWNTLSQQ